MRGRRPHSARMDPRTLIAGRIDLHLRQHLDIGIDTWRALTDEVYMRDVLLVCDAMRKTRLPLLARQFRVAEASVRRPGHDAGPPQAWSADTSGFGVSRPHPLDVTLQGSRARPWYSPRRWRRA
jgi:hypothetical protein